jgi:hypothetical protein
MHEVPIRPRKTKPKPQQHLEAMQTSGRLTQYWREMYRPTAVDVTPTMVVETLNRAGVRPVLMGTHGLAAWRSQPRATKDVDVLVRKKDIRKAIRALQKVYPTLAVQDTQVVARFRDAAIDSVVIDVMKPTQEIFKLVFRHTVSIGKTHEIPDLEMGLVSKFAAMTSHRRERARKGQDIVDFIDIAQHNRAILKRKKLKRLAESLYAGAGEEIDKLVDDIFAGRGIVI